MADKMTISPLASLTATPNTNMTDHDNDSDILSRRHHASNDSIFSEPYLGGRGGDLAGMGANFAHSPSMEFNLIREEDAAILEQGVEEKSGYYLDDFDDEGRRLEACESNASLTELEAESVDAGEGELDINISSWSQRDNGKGLIVGDTVDESSSNDLSTSYVFPLAPHHSIIQTASGDNISMPAIAEDSTIIIPHPTADENSRLHSHMLDTESEEPQERLSEEIDFFIGSTHLQSIPTTQDTDETNHRARTHKLSHHRSASFDRRVIESAQFAEAVGETDSLLLRKIIDEDSSSDFDDDDIDHVDHGGGNVTTHQENSSGGELLVDYKEELQTSANRQADVVAVEQLVGESSEEKKNEPTCVSTDLVKMSLRDQECSNQQVSQQPGESTQLSITVEGEIADEPSTPAPSPCKPKSTLSSSCPPFASPRYVDWKFTRQHSSGSNLDGSNSRHTKNGTILASSSGEADFVYRGIRANPPEITKRGMARGNYAQLHRKAWLEVSDKHHRYGKNLRMYYKHWEALGHPFNMFFDWLDSKGEAMGSPLPNLPEIPRPVLDSDTVLYITNPEVSAVYALDIVVDPVDGSAIIVDQNGNPINTSKEGWIFVLRDHVFYGSQKVIAPNKSPAAEGPNNESLATPASTHRQRFHHSSFFGGKAVASAGIFITDELGRLTRLYPHSGHYRPGEAHMQRALFFFQQLGVELSTFSVDMQQLIKVSREMAPKGGNAPTGDKAENNKENEKENNATTKNGKQLETICQSKHAPAPQNMKKSKKTDRLHLICGLEVACYLTHKALMIEKGVFHQIHKIRRIQKESRNSVCFILDVVNNN